MDTAIRTPGTEPAFHTDDLEQVAGYRTLSALAIIGLLFGLASPLCFVAPVFLAIPLFGAALSILAMRRIAASDGVLAGRWAAAAGLVLCIASIMALVSHHLAMRQLRSRQAEEFGRKWIALNVSGKSEPAFRLTVEGSRRPMPFEPGTPAPETNPYDEFLKQPMIRSLAAAGTDSEIEFAGTLDYTPQPRGQFVIQQRFLVTPASTATPSNPRTDPLEVVLRLQRSQLMGERQSRWLVATYEDAHAEPEATHLH